MREDVLFNPKYYIITEYLGQHYTLITYKGKRIMRYEELPYEIRMRIRSRCLEGASSMYSRIPKVQMEKEYLTREAQAVMESSSYEKDDDSPLHSTSKSSPEESLYDEDVVFQFYANSNGKPKPGKGSGEKITPEKMKEFSQLARIKDWRKTLSNYAITPFVLDGKSWNSVQHYYSAQLFKDTHFETYENLADESGSQMSKDPVLAKVLITKSGKVGDRTIRPPGVRYKELNKEESIEAYNRAYESKFTQNDEARNVLKETKRAKLMQYVRSKKPIEFTHPMKIRKRLLSEE